MYHSKFLTSLARKTVEVPSPSKQNKIRRVITELRKDISDKQGYALSVQQVEDEFNNLRAKVKNKPESLTASEKEAAYRLNLI